MINGKKVMVVMPAYHAEQTLEATYRALPHDVVDHVLLVDDASSDNTVAVAKSLGIDVITHARNRGYGANQKTCYRAALDKGADIIVMVHPDYQYEPRLATAMAAMIESEVYDLVIGSRILGGKARQSGMPWWKYVANRALTAFENLMLGAKLSEYHSGYRAYSADLLQNIPFENNSDDFIFDNQLLAQAIVAGFPVGEISVPTKYFPEASSINLPRSIKYGFGVLGTACLGFLARTKLTKPNLFPTLSKNSKTTLEVTDQRPTKITQQLKTKNGHNKDQINVPSFLIIGAQKSGTSWLHHTLRQHPSIYLPKDKDWEPDFLKPDDFQKFLQRFSQRRSRQISGDACAAWFWTERGADPATGQHRNVADDIANTLGQGIKLIVLLRNPVQRAISAYLHHLKHKTLSPDTSIIDADSNLGIITLSQYGFHLENWLKCYSADNILLLPSPAEANPEDIFSQAINFLGVPPTPESVEDTKKVIMPGMQKLQLSDGVWVPEESLESSKRFANRETKTQTINDKKFVRIISQDEIDAIQRHLELDTRKFLNLVKKYKKMHPAFSGWL